MERTRIVPKRKLHMLATRAAEVCGVSPHYFMYTIAPRVYMARFLGNDNRLYFLRAEVDAVKEVLNDLRNRTTGKLDFSKLTNGKALLKSATEAVAPPPPDKEVEIVAAQERITVYVDARDVSTLKEKGYAVDVVLRP